jgi:hypothetical protein
MNGDQREPQVQTLLGGDTHGKRVAGAYMLVDAALWTLAFFTAGTLSAILLTALASAPLGYLLLRGHSRAAKPSLLVLGAGLVVAAVQCPAGSRSWLLLPGLGVASLVVLLVGDADKERRVVGTVLFTLHVLGMAFMMVISAAPWD